MRRPLNVRWGTKYGLSQKCQLRKNTEQVELEARRFCAHSNFEINFSLRFFIHPTAPIDRPYRYIACSAKMLMDWGFSYVARVVPEYYTGQLTEQTTGRVAIKNEQTMRFLFFIVSLSLLVNRTVPYFCTTSRPLPTCPILLELQCTPQSKKWSWFLRKVDNAFFF